MLEWDWAWEGKGKPNVLCTMCLFSSGIGLKEALLGGGRTDQGNNRWAVLYQRHCCAWPFERGGKE